jgi:serine/threonine protein phosphatase 1
MRRIVLSDLHGCNRTFLALLDTLQLDKRDTLYILGDLVDRGPDSKGVIDTVWRLQREGYAVHCLRGNHEQMMLDARADRNSQHHWVVNGGAAVFQSFGAQDVADIPADYFEWLENLPYFFDLGDCILVHAGLDFRKADPLQDTESMLWIRSWYKQIDYAWLGERILVHGHTPIDSMGIGMQLESLARGRVLDIDNGCVFAGIRPGLGHLCAFDLDARKLYFQANCEAEGKKQ